ncbi:MAG: NAD(P)H-hydrate dehydratase [Proteobacteria bacterium]|nr:NAD(P)H-hydrate dehydratase [Pseudomonadota bacterium]
MKWQASQALPVELYSVEQTRALDRAAIDSGIPGYELMQRAGSAAFALMRYLWPRRDKLLICCGAGNNAGDGYVLARLAADAGYGVEVLSLIDPTELKGEAKQAWEDVGGGEVLREPSTADWSAPIIIDALLGTGLQRPLTGDWADVVGQINRSSARVMALDVPSGIQADSGSVPGVAVRADCTISFIGLNTGLLTGAAPAYCGELYFADLGIPAESVATVGVRAKRISLDEVMSSFPFREVTDHKGRCGHVLVVGGLPGFTGAAAMAASAAVRAGAGLCTVATTPESVNAISAAGPEIMVHGLTRPQAIKPLMARATVAVLGPGLGQTAWSQQAFAMVADGDRPMVLDADGLNILAENTFRRSNWVLTPHPGEAARLLGTSVIDIQSDRLAAAEAIVRQFGGVCVLKGAGTIVACDPESVSDEAGGDLSICSAGSAAMASGGMGDVLSGVIAALLAQGLSSPQAAKLGVCWHAAASDCLQRQGFSAGQQASDLINQLPLLRPASRGRNGA